MFRKCKVETGEIVRLLTETESRSINVQLADAVKRLYNVKKSGEDCLIINT